MQVLSTWATCAFVALTCAMAGPTSARGRTAEAVGATPRQSVSPPDSAPLSVRITSPLGRIGVPGTVRIVAQVGVPSGTALKPVRFYVDSALLATVEHGPPYAAEWIDENPFERREIAVEVEDDRGHTARDSVLLKPFEITEASQVFSVALEAAVKDKQGRFVRGLDPSNFTLKEEGVPQHLEVVRQEDVPATFALLVDRSQSMARRVDFVREAASNFAAYMRPLDRIIVAPFSRQVGPLTGPTNHRDTVTEAIAAIPFGGGTAIVDSLFDMARRLESIDGRRALVLLTDGYDEHSEHTIDETIEALKKSETTVYTIGIGGVAGISLRGEQLLRRVAEETGGRPFFPPRAEELATAYSLVAADAQNRYLLTYTPANQKQDGTWRKIALTTYSSDFSIKTRDGYFAPESPPVRPTLEFTVTDAEWRYLDVTADDLIVTEDGVEQKVEIFQEAVTPLSIVLALDGSGSMRNSAAQVMAAARAFVEALRPTDSLSVVLFNDRVIFAHDLTQTREWSFEAIGQYVATGGTALYDALADSLLRLKRVEGRRAVVVVTDGRDENNAGNGPGSRRTFEAVLAGLKETEATIFPIGIGPKVDRAPLDRLAQLSGGQAYFPEDVGTLQDEYRRISENLRRRYIVSYTSTNSVRDGSWRTVQIRTRSADTLVSSRGGYFAPDR